MERVVVEDRIAEVKDGRFRDDTVCVVVVVVIGGVDVFRDDTVCVVVVVVIGGVDVFGVV